MSIYDSIAAAILPILPQFGVGGPSFVGIRANASTPAAAPTITSLSPRSLYFIAASLVNFRPTFPEVLVWKAPWLVFAAIGVDVQAGDIYTDGTLSYLITGSPVTHYGFVLGPAAPTQTPRSVALQAHAGYQPGLRIGAW